MTAKIKLNAASGGGSFSLQAPSSSSNNRVFTIPDVADGTILTTTNPKAGNIIQVKQTFKTDAFSSTSSSYVDITGMSVDITPSSNSNKILIEVILNYGAASNMYGGIKVLRGSTHIGVSTAVDGNQVNASFGVGTVNGANSNIKVHTAAFKFLDSPSTTSSTTYKLQLYTRNAVTFNLNRPNGDTDDVEVVGGTSSITVQELAA